MVRARSGNRRPVSASKSLTAASPNHLNHDRRGSGEPLILIHGVGSRWQVFEPVLDALAGEREVISIDLPGHGASALSGGRASFAPSGLAGRVAEFMDDLDLPDGKAHLAGNSLGGWISLELAKLGRARSVTGLSPAGLWPGSPPPYIGAVFFASYAMTSWFGALAPRIASDPVLRSLLVGQFFGRPWRLTAREALETLEGFTYSPGIPRVIADGRNERFRDGRSIAVPVTVAFGAREKVLLPGLAQDLRELPPQTRSVRLPGCGHVPTYDAPKLIAKVLLEGSRTT
ncbi:alpha/beta fold hydrolase [Rubrobacter indicoceani]|uniref:alpha/beta fold hydrolase n=1 Tax=Rubrobacter indicoceani TaxID=2051957 RepID=UPI000E5B0863|nr:alpha/beta fold hydrolase [Rubrobacter indicoceani]